MGSKLKVGVLVVLMIASSAALAASASTTVSMDRSSNVDVVTDSNGLIALESQSGPSTGVVQQNSSGALSIDFARDSATGVNPSATFEVGNQSEPVNSYAFNLTNQDATSHDVTLGYTGADQNTDPNIEFQVYNSTGSSVGTVDEEGTTVTHTLNSGEEAYVVIYVDTHGLTDAADLSGTLTIDA